MTIERTAILQKRKAAPSPGQLLFGFFSVFCLFLILRNTEIAITYIHKGLLLCAKTVIPSLFPFMVLSELTVSLCSESRLFKILSKPGQRLFALPTAGCCAVFLGMLCGFPIGARCAVSAYEKGLLNKKQAERVLTFSNNPSSAFLISAVGVSLWQSRHFGLCLYAIVLFSSLLTGIASKFFQKSKAITEEVRNDTAYKANLNGAQLFTSAISSGTRGILLVCAYVVFFSALMGSMNPLLSSLGFSKEVNAGIFCLFELSGGMSAAAGLDNIFAAALLSAAAAGWSGLSVHCQILSVCDGKGLSLRPYFAAKLLQSLLCFLFMAVLLLLFPALPSPGVRI